MESEHDDRSRGGSLGEIHERTVEVDSTLVYALRQLRRRWKTVGAIVVTAITTAAVHRVDGTWSKDAVVFGALTVALLAYTVLTLRSDLKLE